MYTINASNVNEAFQLATQAMNARGIERPSRNGPMLEFPEPVCTTYRFPYERVLFDPIRDANPFFHLMEGLWMLAGRRDLKWIGRFAQNIASYSDDGRYLHGAYGWRWRSHFRGRDQIEMIVDELKRNPDSRRCVLQMWDPMVDLVDGSGKDYPCNTAIYFKVRDGALNMTVSNRSNDLVWGCYGANAVHMSMLQEVMAAQIGVEVGVYNQVSDSLHAYLDTWDKTMGVRTGIIPDAYQTGEVYPRSMVTDPDKWDEDLSNFMICEDVEALPYRNVFFPQVAVPAIRAWKMYKADGLRKGAGLDLALEAVSVICATDWRRAMTDWLQRRAK